MKKNILVGVAFGLAVLFGCLQQHYKFEAAFRLANDTYFGSSCSDAENALTAFLASAEENETLARSEHSLDYDRVLGMSWLKLWSVYNAAGDSRRATLALDHAISYFDKISQFATDPRYTSDKRKGLIDFLNQSETYQKPKWKQSEPHKPTSEPHKK